MKVTEDNFNALLNTGKPVMIDFGATWCGPCKALAPRIEEIEKEYDGRAVVGTADVDECSDLAAKFRIRNVPTVLFFKAGSDMPVDKSVGLVAKETLAEKLNALL
jgi:thioredoxin 1